MLQGVDIAIIVAYLLTTVVIGLVVRKKAQASTGEYLLGGNSLPWYMLGLSNASSSVVSWAVLVLVNIHRVLVPILGQQPASDLMLLSRVPRPTRCTKSQVFQSSV